MPRRALAALVLLLFVACGGGGGSPPPAEPDGSFAVGTTTMTFVDTSRPTAAHGSVPEVDSRTLPTALYYPAVGAAGGRPVTGAAPLAGRTFPLIIFAHGLSGVARVYSDILAGWAAAGYVVAGPDFPLSKGPAGSIAEDYINQPADESFLIDELLRLHDEGSSPVAALIDPERIGASGQSLGGMTTFGIAFNTCCRDPRIDAAAPMAGFLAPFPLGTYDAAIGPPLLIIHGDADDTVDYAGALEAFDFAAPPKFLLTHLGGGHILPYVGSNDATAIQATIDSSTAFFDHYLKHERGALERLDAVGRRERVALVADRG